FHAKLDSALRMFKRSRAEALRLIYAHKDIAGGGARPAASTSSASPSAPAPASLSRRAEDEADYEEVAASCGHFSFSLQEFGEQLRGFLDILDLLQIEVDARPAGKTWRWLKPSAWFGWDNGGGGGRYMPLSSSSSPALARTGMGIDASSRSGSSNALRSLTRESMSAVPLPYRHGTNQSTSSSSASRGLSSSGGGRLAIPPPLLRLLNWFERDEAKYALKVGIGAALYALPAFASSTRPIYSHWRGEWGLLSYMIVCSMTIGASNTTGFARFFGTCLGACCALLAWEASGASAVWLALCGWLMATWTSYIIVARGQGPMGRFIMLTYNLIVLYAYSLVYYDADPNDDGPDDEGGDNPIISEIALHRVVSVLTGIIWGIVITRLVWPISARAKLKDGLSLVWLWMSLIWKRDPLSQLTAAAGAGSTEAQSTSQAQAQSTSPVPAYFTPREKFELQRALASLESYCAAARAESGIGVDLGIVGRLFGCGPSLDNGFPAETYARLIRRTQSLLDAFQTINVEILKNAGVSQSQGQAAMLLYTLPERVQVSSRISHLLTVLASSMKLEYPLNDVLPNIEHARDRLLARLHRFRRDLSMSRDTADEDYALLYAYTLVTSQINNDIAAITEEVSCLFGLLDEEALRMKI
ncbi:hypothetical protein KEM52_001210, partial [Ascosphaera acerosa]